MSQEYSSSRRTRRTTRSQRNKPILITPSDTAVENVDGRDRCITSSDETTASSDQIASSSTATITEPKPLVVPAPAEKSARKLPGFFSTVKKGEQDTASKETKESEVAQARLTRATRGKPPVETGTKVAAITGKTSVAESKNTASTSAAKSTATKPPSLFKTRYIIGMGIYLIAADFLGLYEQRLLSSLGLEKQLTQFNLFGGTLHVNTSTIVFLASLVIILVLLARFDLIPRSLGGASGQKRTGQTSTRNNSNSTPGERTVQPTTRQGVKGSDDSLYQQYRTGQRRQKRR